MQFWTIASNFVILVDVCLHFFEASEPEINLNQMVPTLIGHSVEWQIFSVSVDEVSVSRELESLRYENQDQ